MADMNFGSVGPVMFTQDGVSQVSAATAVPKASIGDRVFHKGEEYVLCYNAGGASITQGHGVKFITAASGYSVAATALTDVYNPCVGVAKHCAIPAAEYGWIMTKGFASVTVVTAMTADYKMLALGASGCFIEASGTTTLGTATKVGAALNINASAMIAGAAYAFINTGA